MHAILRVVVAWSLVAGGLRAQALGFHDFTWTFQSSGDATGFVTAELLHVTGPSQGGCNDEYITLWLQAWLHDPAGPVGWSATRAMSSPRR